MGVDGGGSITLSQIGQVTEIVGPVCGAIFMLFKTVGSTIKAAIERQAETRDLIEQSNSKTFDLHDSRIAQLERDGASRKDLDDMEARIKSDISDVKGDVRTMRAEVKEDVRDMRNSTQHILQQVSALSALLGSKRGAQGHSEG